MPPTPVTEMVEGYGAAIVASLMAIAAGLLKVEQEAGPAVAVGEAVGTGDGLGDAVGTGLGVPVGAGVGVVQAALARVKFAAVTVPVSPPAPSRIVRVHVPLTCAVDRPANAAVKFVTGAGIDWGPPAVDR